MKKLLFLFFTILFINCNSTSSEINSISKTELQQLLDTTFNIQLLDVRSEKEFQQGYIKGAIQIDVRSDDFLENVLQQMDPTKPVYLYCKSGSRSIKAGNALKEKFNSIYYLKGGYNNWSQNQK